MEPCPKGVSKHYQGKLTKSDSQGEINGLTGIRLGHEGFQSAQAAEDRYFLLFPDRNTGFFAPRILKYLSICTLLNSFSQRQYGV